jgi:hypothetical protein
MTPVAGDGPRNAPLKKLLEQPVNQGDGDKGGQTGQGGICIDSRLESGFRLAHGA